MIYLDSSALLKLLFEEDESEALEQWLLATGDAAKVTSQLATVEVVRACRRIDEKVVPRARQLLGGLDLVPFREDVLERAATVGDPLVRSLDAIHLASGLSLGPALLAFVTYDSRLQAAAAAENLEVATPAPGSGLYPSVPTA